MKLQMRREANEMKDKLCQNTTLNGGFGTVLTQ